MTRSLIAAALGAAVCATVATSVSAQVIQPPDRPERGLFGGQRPDPERSHQEVTFVGTALTGQADDSTPGAAAAGFEYGSTIAFGSGDLRYFVGKTTRSIEVAGRAYVNTFPRSDVDPSFGGSMRSSGTVTIKRTRLAGGLSAIYDPYFTLGGFSNLDEDVTGGTSPEANPLQGYANQSSVTYGANASVSEQWSRRQSTTATFGVMTRQQRSGLVRDGDNRSVGLGHTVSIGRATRIGSSYSLMEISVDADVTPVPLRNHTMEVSFSHDQRLSRTRSVSLTVGGGGNYTENEFATVDEPGYDYWSPTANASIRVEVWRSWAFWTDYQRTVTVLDRISRQAFPSNTIFLRTGGLIGRRIQTVISAGYAAGQTGISGDSGRYENKTATAQISYAIARCCSTVLNYSRYDYNIVGLRDAPAGLPANAERDSINVGFSVNVPLYNSQRRATPPRRQN